MSDFIISVSCDKDFSQAAAITDFIGCWLNHPRRTIRPDRYDFGEPIKKTLSECNLHELVDDWLSEGRAVMLKRTKKPRFVADIKWRRKKGKDERLFPWGCTIWLNKLAGDLVAEELLRFLISKLDPAFAYISDEEDQKNKHFIRYNDRVGMVEQYVGLDVGETLPGVYWKTYLGKWAIDKLGGWTIVGKLKNISTHFDTGLLISAYPESSSIEASDKLKLEDQIIQTLGKGHFFDKRNFDSSNLALDKKNADIINTKVS